MDNVLYALHEWIISKYKLSSTHISKSPGILIDYSYKPKDTDIVVMYHNLGSKNILDNFIEIDIIRKYVGSELIIRNLLIEHPHPDFWMLACLLFWLIYRLQLLGL